MSSAADQRLLDALLDAWDRNNAILLNLLQALPDGGLEIRAMEGGPSVAQLFTHIHSVRLVFVFEDAPEFAQDLPEQEWAAERSPDRIARMLNESAKAVREAVRDRVESGKDMDLHYEPDSPAPAHALARRLPPWSDQAGPQVGRTPDPRPRSRAGHLGSLDAQEGTLLGFAPSESKAGLR